MVLQWAGGAQADDEAERFTEAEFAAAFSIIAPPSEAARMARETKQGRERDDEGPTWQLAPDVLDLLSLVSEDCAARVASIRGLTAEEAKLRRADAAARFGKHLD